MKIHQTRKRNNVEGCREVRGKCRFQEELNLEPKLVTWRLHWCVQVSHRGKKAGCRLCVDGPKLKKLTIWNQPAGWGAAAASHLHNSTLRLGNLMELLWIFMERIKYLMLTFLKHSCPMLNSTHTRINPRQPHGSSFPHSKLMPTTFYICPLSTPRPSSTRRTFFCCLPVAQRIHLMSISGLNWRPACLPQCKHAQRNSTAAWLQPHMEIFQWGVKQPNLVESARRSASVPTTHIQQASNVKLLGDKLLAVNKLKRYGWGNVSVEAHAHSPAAKG